jgi:1-deoxyxylulose-5-phosphate synthase
LRPRARAGERLPLKPGAAGDGFRYRARLFRRVSDLPLARLGLAGARVTRICLGTMGFGAKAWRPWVVERDEALPILRRALDLGINFLDTADMYSVGASERIVGEALAGRREEVVLATKGYHPMGPGPIDWSVDLASQQSRFGPNDQGLSRKHLVAALRGSLERLGTDHVDLYQIHRFDGETPADETLGTLSSFVDQGKARYLGASTMWAWQFALLLARQREKGWHPFVTMQNHWNLAYREEEREMAPLCRHEGVGMIPWSPLARGFLAGRESRERGARRTTDRGRSFYDDKTSHEIAERVDELAKRRSATPSQVALAWLLHQPGVVAPIVGVTKMQHLEEAVGALALRLDASDLRWLEEPYRPRPVSGWFRSGDVPREHLHPDEP